MEYVKVPLFAVKNSLNAHFAGKEPWQIAAVTASSVLAGVWIYNFIFDDECLISRTKKTAFRLAKKIPAIKSRIDKEVLKVRNDFRGEVESRTGHLDYITSLPESGMTSTEVLAKIQSTLELGNYDWKNGKVSGAVYGTDPEIWKLVTDVYGCTAYTNPLHPDIFPGISKVEAEVVKMVGKLLNGDSEVCGSMTNGGTESILMACKAYRDYAREVKGIKKPEIVVPFSVHSAFDKAAQYFGLRVRTIPLDKKTYKVDLKAMERAIGRNTIMLVGSAPNYPYGTMDDIASISELGLKYDVPVHVDSCLGGFLTMFMAAAGHPTPVCDFRLKGVTSISADTHKYGYAPKGTSVVVYRDVKYLHHQYTVTTDWPGGVYGSPSMCGSRAGGNIAVCWATMLKVGLDGYVKATREIIETARYIEKRLREIDSIFIFGQPATSVVAMGSDTFHIYRLANALTKLGWNLNTLQYPCGIHICVTHVHTKPRLADQLIKDVRDSIAEIMKDPTAAPEGKLAMYGVAQKIPDRSLVGEFIRCFIDSLTYVPEKK